MIYFPLLLVGVERVLHKEKPWLLVGMVFVSEISNFYFFYMIVLMTVIYVVFRLWSLYHAVGNMKKAVYSILQIGVFSFLGVGLGAFLLLPIILFFIGDRRNAVGSSYGVFWPISFYEAFLSGFVSYGDIGRWTDMGYASPALLAVFLLFKRNKTKKESIYLKTAFCLLTLFLLFPVFGHVFNGFSYAANRYIWAYSLLIAYILVHMWNRLEKMEIKDSIFLFVILLGYTAICMFLNKSRTFNMMFAVMTAMILLFLMLLINQNVVLAKDHVKKGSCILAAIIIAIEGNAFFGYSVKGKNYIQEFEDLKTVNTDLLQTHDEAVKEAADTTGFYRYTGMDLDWNTSLIAKTNGTAYLWSLLNGNIGEFYEKLDFLESMTQGTPEPDGRTFLNALASVRYFVTRGEEEEKQYVPFGYSLVDSYEINEEYYWIYKNKNQLPFAYTYGNAMSEDEFEKLTSLKKQEVMLQSVVLEKVPQKYAGTEIQFEEKDIPYRIKCDNENVTVKENRFIVTKKNTSVTLEFEGLDNSETYLAIEGLEYTGFPTLDLYMEENADPQNLYSQEEWEELSVYEKRRLKEEARYWQELETVPISITDGESKPVKKLLKYRTREFSWYSGRHDFLVNMCYSKTPKTKIKITFPEIGTYSFDKLSVLCQPMDHYTEKIKLLKNNKMHNIKIKNDYITGTISLDKAQIVCFSLPYDKGWSAYVDGEKVELLKANIMYSALDIGEGEHSIKLVYHTPGLNSGVCVSLITLLGICVLAVFRKKQMKK